MKNLGRPRVLPGPVGETDPTRSATMPMGSSRPHSRLALADGRLSRASLLYGWSLRSLFFVAPFVAVRVKPLLALAMLVLVGALTLFDQVPAR